MRHNIASELTEAMDSLYFSSDTKENMVKMLMKQQKAVHAKSVPAKGRKLLLVAVVSAAVLATLTGAAVFTRWSKTAQAAYNPPQQVKEQAEKTGLSVMLENKTEETNPGEVLSATDQGITITAVQSIVDNYGAKLFFRVEGFTLPEGRAPGLFWDRDRVTIDGSTEFYDSMTGWFYDGTTRNEAGEWVYASNGQPVKFGNDKYQSAIYQWVADDGSLEYQMDIRFRDNGESYLGKEFAIHFDGIGVGPEKGGIMEEPLVSGNWDLHWTLTGADNTENAVTITPNAEIGDSGLTLLEAEIGQMSIRAVYQSDHDWDGWKQLESLSPGLYQIRMKDGSTVRVVPTQEDYGRWETERICEVAYETFDGILDVSQLDSLAYDKGSEIGADGKRIHIFDYIPIQ